MLAYIRRVRHPRDKGSRAQIAATIAMRPLLDPKFWRKHPAPFNKTERGAKRRAEKRHARERKEPPC